MKAALKHIFGDKINTSMNGEYAMVFEQSKSPKNKLNLMDKQKKYCVICNSKMHWTKNCLHKTNTKLFNIAETICDDNNYDEVVNMIVMTNEYQIFISEMEVNAIFDTACTNTVSVKKLVS